MHARKTPRHSEIGQLFKSMDEYPRCRPRCHQTQLSIHLNISVEAKVCRTISGIVSLLAIFPIFPTPQESVVGEIEKLAATSAIF